MKDYKDLIARLNEGANYILKTVSPNERGLHAAAEDMCEAADALEALTAPVSSEPVAWMFSNNCGTHFTDDKRDWYDAVGIESVIPLYPESRVRQLEQQVKMLRDALVECRKVFANYALHHRKKSPPDHEKTIANSTMCEMCSAALAATEEKK